MITLTYAFLLAVKLSSPTGGEAELVNKYHTMKECKQELKANQRAVLEGTGADLLQCVRISVKVEPADTSTSPKGE